MKLFYICPHLSTGGQPQYTLKMVESFKDDFDITVIEVNNYSDEYVVQRNKIKNICNLFQLHGKYEGLIPYLIENQPDILHFQEIPESFLTYNILKEIYATSRKYDIVVTTHSSLTSPENFTFIPDRIVAVNDWQRDRLQSITETLVWEYPIEKKDRCLGKNFFRKYLGIKEVDGLHILNVGLFTPGKNQGELFEIARNNPQNIYHFVGNQAQNFEDYWRPLMRNKPDNCFVWGERNDVDVFYQACDEFYFTSKFELNPLVIKEALSYGLPVKMKRLETYGTYYDNNSLVTYI